MYNNSKKVLSLKLWYVIILIVVRSVRTDVCNIQTNIMRDVMDNKYLVIDKEILPEVFEKVLVAKELLRKGKVKGITEAVKQAQISRSTFYKYKDYVFTLSEGTKGKKVTISMLLRHEPGILSTILNKMAEKNGNILTINQDIPINGIANVSITFDVTDLTTHLDEVMDEIKKSKGVVKLDLIAME